MGGRINILNSRTCLLLLLQVFTASVARSQVTLRIVPRGETREVTRMNFQNRFADKPSALKEINRVLFTLQDNGFLLAAADSLTTDSARVSCVIRTGGRYQLAHLRMGNLDHHVATRLALNEKLYLGKPFRYREVAATLEKIVRYYEDRGHPFARASLDSVTIDSTVITAALAVDPGRAYRVDSIRVVGTANVRLSFLRRYLDLRKGMPYSESVLRNAAARLRQLPFVFQPRGQEARISDRSTVLLLFLDKKPASQFDGIVGLLPDANTGKTIVTGDVKLRLVNGIFRAGETVDIEWRRLRSQTQDFNGRLIYPYLFGTLFGTDLGLKIYRKDIAFIDINSTAGIQYYFSGLNYFKVFYRQRNANLISTSGLEFATALPDYADITTNAYGAGLFLELLDYRFNPRKGVSITTNFQVGDRVIHRNPNVNDAAYNGLLLHSTQYQGDLRTDGYVPLGGRNVLHLAVQAAGISGNSVIFRNELLRIGGLKTLRGFDEESIFVSGFVIPTLEYRFLFSQNSNILLFAEGAWYENNSNRRYISDTPVSFGAGVNFDTKAGILTLNYALGNQFGNGFDVRSGKIHFGLTALF